ncbi:MAG: DUF1295 domain-containing protein [Rhizomicrobium sp.]
MALCFAALWLVAIRLRDVSFVDAWWAFGRVVLAWASFLGGGAITERKIVLLALCTAWGMRAGRASVAGAGAGTGRTAAMSPCWARRRASAA